MIGGVRATAQRIVGEANGPYEGFGVAAIEERPQFVEPGVVLAVQFQFNIIHGKVLFLPYPGERGDPGDSAYL